MSLIHNISTWLLSSKESPKTTKQFVPWNQLSKVVIIAYDNQLSNCVDFINICKKDNIDAYVAIIYDGKPEQAPMPSFEYILLNKKQFNFFGLPTADAIQKLNSKPIDVLINLGNEEQIKSLALSKLVAAKCKVGNFSSSIFEITINSDKSMNTSDYLKQVVVYLNMIKTK